MHKVKVFWVVLMKREANGFEAYKDITRSVGVPTKTVADNAQILIGTK